MIIQAILIIIVAGLLGRGALRALYRRPLEQGLFQEDYYIVGGMVIIGLTEVAHMAAVVLGRSFSDCVKLFGAGLVALLLLSAFLIAWGRRLERHDKLFVKEMSRRKLKKTVTADGQQTDKTIIYAIFGIMVLIQIILLATTQNFYPTGDMTLETVNSMLTNNGIYTVNPMTGQPYTVGLPLRLQILCLPTLYAILCSIFGTSAVEIVWGIVPVLVLLGSYLAYYTVAKAIFSEDEKKRGIFMIVVALILWIHVAMYGTDGFGVQFAGYRGVSIRLGILLPYTFGLILRKKWRLLPLCILAEACIVWTLYGMGACLFVTVAMVGSDLAIRGLQKVKAKKEQSDKEGGL